MTGERIIDINYELSNLRGKIKYDNYIIFAKSVGIALAIKGVKEKKLKPEGCIFLGTPIYWAREHNISLDFWIKNYYVSSLFIQNSKDPAIAAADLKKFLIDKKVRNYEFYEFENKSHDYEDIEKIRELVLNFSKPRK